MLLWVLMVNLSCYQGSAGLTLCIQPRRILPQQAAERAKFVRNFEPRDYAVGWKIARDGAYDDKTKVFT